MNIELVYHDKSRLEAFSDGVIAIIIAIMVWSRKCPLMQQSTAKKISK